METPMSNGTHQPAMRRSLARIVVIGACVVAACSAAGTPRPSVSSPQPSTTAPASPIEHRTGPNDLILRMEVGGGFVPIGYFVSQAPSFSLYGDGTVVFRSRLTAGPSPLPSPFSSVIRMAHFRTGRLSEAEIQALLAFALDTGGLRAARATYDPGNIADAPSTIFTINASGLAKVVTIVALGMVSWPTAEPAIDGFNRLAERLDAFEFSGNLPGTYVPDRFRSVLVDIEIAQPLELHSWPWSNRRPSDWVRPTEPQRPPFPSLVLTSAEVGQLGLPNPVGGFQNLLLRGPDAKLYTLAVRPLLPDETS
jgi:hypothetical protein